jgi:lysophospholipase L1-like esterase
VSNPVPTARIAALAALLVALASFGAPAGAAERRAVLDLGDSLSVGTAPYLKRELRGYRVESVHDVGLHAEDAAKLVARVRANLPPVLVVSAGTNDDPRIVSAFSRSVSSVVKAAGRARCVVWPTIARPPAAGATYAGLNRALVRAAARRPNLVVVDWVGMVRRHPRWLSRDGVHVSAEGYRARARAIGVAVKMRCSS